MLIYYGVTAAEYANEEPLLREEFDTLEFYDGGAAWIGIVVAILFVCGLGAYYFFVYRGTKARQQEEQQRADALKAKMTAAASKLPSEQFETNATKLMADFTPQMETFDPTLQDALANNLRSAIDSRRQTIQSKSTV